MVQRESRTVSAMIARVFRTASPAAGVQVLVNRVSMTSEVLRVVRDCNVRGCSGTEIHRCDALNILSAAVGYFSCD